jgi:predicted DNA-binding transcriptional regulator YafY
MILWKKAETHIVHGKPGLGKTRKVMVEEEVIITYKSSSSEITKRKISNIVSKVSNEVYERKIYAYCHLRSSTRTFKFTSILKIEVNGSTVDKDLFYYDHLKEKDKNNFLNNLADEYAMRSLAFKRFLEFYENVKSHDTARKTAGNSFASSLADEAMTDD